MADEEIIDLDASVEPGAVSESVITDVLRWSPIIQKIGAAIKAAIAGGPLSIPAITVRIFGKHVTLGPIPIKIGA
jgi:hypothetical protein